MRVVYKLVLLAKPEAAEVLNGQDVPDFGAWRRAQLKNA